MLREIYLAGGCFWGAEKYLAGIRGVRETRVGYANGHTERPSYEQVKHEHTGHAETVRVRYDDAELPLETLLSLFYLAIDPTTVDRQGGDIGHQYRTGIYYTDEGDAAVIRASLARLERRIGKKVAVECAPLMQFFDAEEYHQDYLDKNPDGYCHVPLAQLRWIRTVDPAQWTEDSVAPAFPHAHE